MSVCVCVCVCERERESVHSHLQTLSSVSVAQCGSSPVSSSSPAGHLAAGHGSQDPSAPTGREGGRGGREEGEGGREGEREGGRDEYWPTRCT